MRLLSLCHASVSEAHAGQSSCCKHDPGLASPRDRFFLAIGFIAEIDNEVEPSAFRVTFLGIFVVALLSGTTGSQAQGRRVALVIGNSAYVSATKLDK